MMGGRDEEGMMTEETNEKGRWVAGCPGCGAALRVKNCALVVDGDGCDNCRGWEADRDDVDRGVAAEMGWCGCGNPELVDEAMLRFLEAVDANLPPETDRLTGLLLAYVADDLGWVDHGSSVYAGWLTDDGREAIANLRGLVGAGVS